MNIHRGTDALGRDRLDDIAYLITTYRPDLVGLQEVRRNDPATRNLFQDVWLAGDTGMTSIYQPLVWLRDGIAHGNAVLTSVHPDADESLVVNGRRELRGILRVAVTYAGKRLDFISTHLGLDANERAAQIAQLVALIPGPEIPTIIVGDFNVSVTSPELAPLRTVASEVTSLLELDPASQATFPADRPSQRIDQIWVSGPLEVLDARVIDTDISDHKPVIASIGLRGYE